MVANQINWTVMIDSLRRMAEVEGKTAREIAEALGIGEENRHRIFAAARRYGIRLPGPISRRTQDDFRVHVSAEHRATIRALSDNLQLPRRDVLAHIVSACLQEGVTFCTNLLDGE